MQNQTTRTLTEVKEQESDKSKIVQRLLHNQALPTEQAGIRATNRLFTETGKDPYANIRWEKRDARIGGDKGEDVFFQAGVEFPEFWSQMASNVVASKYFRGSLQAKDREWSLRQLIDRVANTIAKWGQEQGYFANEQAGNAFCDELKYLLVHQYAAFNSPVWFNCGIEPNPQVSACFINSVDDDLQSILKLAVTEGSLFKYGSGTGTNFSKLRSSQEELSGGGTASGPVSFMKGFDSFAGVIKSGGKTRRAAKMVILDADHPDIEEFVESKATEEKKAWALIDQGYDGSFNGEAYQSVQFQNANHSVRVNDEFMHAVETDAKWPLKYVSTKNTAKWLRARALMKKISEAAHVCGDPGIQFDTTINTWHTCKGSGRINASNPCSEFMFLDNSACNLASLNLMKFVDEQSALDIVGLRHAASIMFTAQEILVDKASYPTEKITINSRRYRPLGLGYANLGAYLMSRGLAYDSEEARAVAAGITAVISGQAYLTSTQLAEQKGPFEAYPENTESMMQVMQRHRDAVNTISTDTLALPLKEEALRIWDEVLLQGEKNGFRNAQATLLAPTGTIGFMMDCDTTGIEPDIALVKYKQLVGGGTVKLVNHSIDKALQNLAYDADAREKIIAYVEEHGTIEGAPDFSREHLPVFDCALVPTNGERSISPYGHIRMMAAVQPFISGAISKTVNVPNDFSPKDISDIYQNSWELGLKAVAVYRDGSKRIQPLLTKEKSSNDKQKNQNSEKLAPRRKMPLERQAITHKFTIGGHEGYLTVGMFENGDPGEIFIVISKEGSTISGLMDSFATSVSLALQYGVPLNVLVEKFSHSRFEPAGFTGNPQIPIAKSIMDYIFRWLELKFLKQTNDKPVEDKEHTLQVVAAPLPASTPTSIFQNQVDAPACSTCGTIMVRNGSCYRCANCGNTSGCS